MLLSILISAFLLFCGVSAGMRISLWSHRRDKDADWRPLHSYSLLFELLGLVLGAIAMIILLINQ